MENQTRVEESKIIVSIGHRDNGQTIDNSLEVIGIDCGVLTLIESLSVLATNLQDLVGHELWEIKTISCMLGQLENRFDYLLWGEPPPEPV